MPIDPFKISVVVMTHERATYDKGIIWALKWLKFGWFFFLGGGGCSIFHILFIVQHLFKNIFIKDRKWQTTLIFSTSYLTVSYDLRNNSCYIILSVVVFSLLYLSFISITLNIIFPTIYSCLFCYELHKNLIAFICNTLHALFIKALF